MIVDGNLEALIKKYQIVDNPDRYDTTCITLTLDNVIKKYEVPNGEIISYDDDGIEQFVRQESIKKSKGLTLEPHQAVLACSAETIQMPKYCFGLLQTKGSLARLFVFINCADGQIDPGYNGKVTFELYNASNFKIKIKPGQAVGNLYLFKTSTSSKGYAGRYQGAKCPTCSKSR